MSYPKTVTLWKIPIRNEQGEVVGYLVNTREISAREAWDIRIMRKLFQDSIRGCEQIFRTPIFKEDK